MSMKKTDKKGYWICPAAFEGICPDHMCEGASIPHSHHKDCCDNECKNHSELNNSSTKCRKMTKREAALILL